MTDMEQQIITAETHTTNEILKTPAPKTTQNQTLDYLQKSKQCRYCKENNHLTNDRPKLSKLFKVAQILMHQNVQIAKHQEMMNKSNMLKLICKMTQVGTILKYKKENHRSLQTISENPLTQNQK